MDCTGSSMGITNDSVNPRISKRVKLNDHKSEKKSSKHKNASDKFNK